MKDVLIESAPDIYFETDHYKDWPAILVRLSRADDAELQQCLHRAWQLQAPKKLVARHEAGTAAPAKKSVRRSPAKK
jgi:hypothetical protein